MEEKLNKMRITIVLYALFLFNIFLIYSNLSIYHQGYGSSVLSELYLLFEFLVQQWRVLQIIAISILVVLLMIRLKKNKKYKLMKNKLDILKSMYLLLLEKVPDAIFIFSYKGILLKNTQADEVFERKKGGGYYIGDNESFEQLSQLVLESSVPLNLSDYKIVDKKNVEQYFDIDTINNTIGNEKIDIMIVKDKIAEKNEAYGLEEKLTYSQEILAKMSHELRTPINVLQGVLASSLATIQQIEDQEIQEKMLKYAGIFDRNLLRILKLSENVIDLMEMDASHEQMNFRNCNVVNLIKNITDASVDFADQKKLRIELMNNMKSGYCAVDVDKLEKMILNLLSNAVKYGKKDTEILVNINENAHKLNIDVCSKGDKIEPRDQEKMFKLFYQRGNLLNRTHEGLGLGLHFVKEYAKMHGGKVGVSSDCEGNNVFSINLPKRTSEALEYGDVVADAELCRQKVKIEFSDI